MESHLINEKYVIDFWIPNYLEKDIELLEKGIEEDSSILDCLQDNLYGTVNMAFINAGAITKDQAATIRKRYWL